jgi:hypothetical protein
MSSFVACDLFAVRQALSFPQLHSQLRGAHPLNQTLLFTEGDEYEEVCSVAYYGRPLCNVFGKSKTST